jgi:hypothetical protein
MPLGGLSLSHHSSAPSVIHPVRHCLASRDPPRPPASCSTCTVCTYAVRTSAQKLFAQDMAWPLTFIGMCSLLDGRQQQDGAKCKNWKCANRKLRRAAANNITLPAAAAAAAAMSQPSVATPAACYKPQGSIPKPSGLVASDALHLQCSKGRSHKAACA